MSNSDGQQGLPDDLTCGVWNSCQLLHYLPFSIYSDRSISQQGLPDDLTRGVWNSCQLLHYLPFSIYSDRSISQQGLPDDLTRGVWNSCQLLHYLPFSIYSDRSISQQGLPDDLTVIVCVPFTASLPIVLQGLHLCNSAYKSGICREHTNNLAGNNRLGKMLQ